VTIRSTIGTAEVTLEGIETRYAIGEAHAPTYDLGDLLLALTEVLRAVGDYRLPELAGKVLALLEGEDPEEDTGPVCAQCGHGDRALADVQGDLLCGECVAYNESRCG
jgi:hypothetical protein